MSLPQATLRQRENDRIDFATADFGLIVGLEVENLSEEWTRETYLWHRINDAKGTSPHSCRPSSGEKKS